jgi:hypothetical protein
VEGYFSIFKRGMKGVYQHCAKRICTATRLSSSSATIIALRQRAWTIRGITETFLNPAVAVDWTFEQIGNVANGTPTDERVDIATLFALHEVAIPPKDGAFKTFWLQYKGQRIAIDAQLSERARAAALEKQKERGPRRWHTGVSLGQIFGDLRAVIDEAGRTRVRNPSAYWPGSCGLQVS